VLKTVTTRNTLLLHLLRDHLLNSRDNFGARHRSHATEVEGAFPQKTGTTFDMVPKNPMPLSQWRGALRLGRTENRHRGNAKQVGQVHCPGIVSKQEIATAQFIDQLLECSLADSIHTFVTQRLSDFGTDGYVSSGAEENPLHWESPRNFLRHLCETWPLFGRTVLGAGAEP
jgi:hypothetical protein